MPSKIFLMEKVWIFTFEKYLKSIPGKNLVLRDDCSFEVELEQIFASHVFVDREKNNGYIEFKYEWVSFTFTYGYLRSNNVN